MTLASFLEKEVFGPLNMKDTGYDPEASRCAPTSSDRSTVTRMSFETGVLSADLSAETRTFVSGKYAAARPWRAWPRRGTLVSLVRLPRIIVVNCRVFTKPADFVATVMCASNHTRHYIKTD